MKKKWIVIIIIAAIIFVILAGFLLREKLLPKDYCLNGLECNQWYSCCGGWQCTDKDVQTIDCMMMCEKPALGSSPYTCACLNNKCALVGRDELQN